MRKDGEDQVESRVGGRKESDASNHFNEKIREREAWKVSLGGQGGGDNGTWRRPYANRVCIRELRSL